MSMDGVPVRWSKPALVAFRFSFVYLAVYNVSGLIYYTPWAGEWLAKRYSWPWDQLGVWVGDTLFGIDAHRQERTGSGDTWADYVFVFNLLVLSSVATVVWSLRDRRRVEYAQLLDHLRSYVRLVLGVTLISYGLAKVLGTQFGTLDSYDMTRTFGESSPMGLLWRFMAHSPGYQLFTGLVECIGGALLFWRRTTLLGALVCAAAMLQVFLLNVCFDVCVKLYSLHLALFSVWLVLPDLRRLVDFFLLERTVGPRPPRVPFARPWLERARRPLKYLVLAALLFENGRQALDYHDQVYGKPPHPMHQVYAVESHGVAGVEKPPLTTDATRWKQVVLHQYGFAVITFMDDHRVGFAHAIDETARTITLTSYDHAKSPDLVLRYTQPDAEHLALALDLDGAPHAIRVKVVPRSSFLLARRGIHWHTELPFNR